MPNIYTFEEQYLCNIFLNLPGILLATVLFKVYTDLISIPL